MRISTVSRAIAARLWIVRYGQVKPGDEVGEGPPDADWRELVRVAHQDQPLDMPKIKCEEDASRSSMVSIEHSSMTTVRSCGVGFTLKERTLTDPS